METRASSGVLYLCATPIGNLEDITLRVLRTLKEVDLVAAEDTRHTRKLFSRYDIHTPLTSYHEHNRQAKEGYLLEQLLSGKHVALVSDAGTPGISDPGEELVRKAVDNGVQVTALPGPSALLAALTISGLSLHTFAFEGFLPVSKKERRTRLAKLAKETRTIVVYESPHRLVKTLGELADFLGSGRRACMARELTKFYEDVQRSTLGELHALMSNHSIKGEFVLVIEGCDAQSYWSGCVASNCPEDNIAELVPTTEQYLDETDSFGLSLEDLFNLFKEEGMAPNKAIKLIARLKNISRRELYNRIHKQKK